ncbi:sensor histidine kinase [Magnetospirillum moscoviense]|uniref:histidine kinase n=1 Tax=Magnetospirillum moscoviense TaxID=1437059 RepID=A0A178MJA1_9PROT|nr:PAS domain S-box protein [Magnetospirillum moscoviense]OAN48812.1 hypothetical protein A6A05_14370 [Magnetospirillum moscoviense]
MSQTVETPPLLRWGPVAIAVGVTVVLFLTVSTGYFQAIADREERAVASARTIEQGVTRTLESVETTLSMIAEEARSGLAGDDRNLAAARRRMADSLRLAPHIRQLAILRGTTVLADTNGPDGTKVDLAMLGLDKNQAAPTGHGLRIGTLQKSRFLPHQGELPDQHSLRSLIPVALVAADSTSTAPLMIVAALNTAYLEEIFTSGAFSRGSHHALVRQDGQPLIATDGLIDWNAPLAAMLSSGADQHFVSVQSLAVPLGATALRLSARYPMAVVIGVRHAETLRDWAGRNRTILAVLAVVSLGAAAVLFVVLRQALVRRSLQAQVRVLVKAIEQSPVVVMVTDADGVIDYVNPAFTRLFGYTAEQAVGRNPRLLNSGQNPPENYRSLWDCLTRGQSWSGEFINRANDGSLVHVSSTISAVRDSHDRTTHFIGVMADITEAKRAERERESLILRLGRANEGLQRFAEISAHHLQEPARRLVSFAQRLKMRLIGRFEDEDAQVSLAFIEQQAGRLRDLLRDVQLYLAADVPLGAQSEIDTARVARDVVLRFGPRIEAAHARILVTDLPHLTIDAPRLADLFAILLENAISYRRPDMAPEVIISGETTADRVRLTVADNGTGIAPEFRERVFRVFERLPRTGDMQGTGIGLAIARRIVESNSGQIWIEETPGGGVTVVVEFEVAEKS